MNIKIVSAGVGDGHPKKKCSWCDKKLKKDEGIATCTHTEYVTLCPKCYSKAGNSVR
jgi:hypothetical protein